MKRRLALLLSITILAMCSLTACGNKTNTDEENNTLVNTETSNKGIYLFSDEKLSAEALSDSTYKYELAYRLLGEDIKYIYFTPGENTILEDCEILSNYSKGGYYSKFVMNNMRVAISNGICTVICEEEQESLITTDFSLRQIKH